VVSSKVSLCRNKASGKIFVLIDSVYPATMKYCTVADRRSDGSVSKNYPIVLFDTKPTQSQLRNGLFTSEADLVRCRKDPVLSFLLGFF